MSDKLEKLTQGIGKTIPDIYDDGLKLATQETGKTIALIPRAINAALVPLRQWISEREYKLAETEKLLAQRLKDTPPEKVVTPEAYVAIPAMQAISYSMDSKELRNLYANLLANSMNTDTKSQVHPAFVEIIRQLSPNDALILNYINSQGVLPVIDISLSLGEGVKAAFFQNYSCFKILDTYQCSISIENLVRLGLVNFPLNKVFSDNSAYNIIIESAKETLRSSLGANYPLEPDYTITKKCITRTIWGESFYNICVKDFQ